LPSVIRFIFSAVEQARIFSVSCWTTGPLKPTFITRSASLFWLYSGNEVMTFISEVDSLGAVSDHSEREAMALLEAARSIMKNRSFDETAREIFNCLKQAIGATAGYVAMLSPDGIENQVLFLDSGGRECSVDPSLPMPIRGLRGLAYSGHTVVYDNDFDNSKWVKYMPKGHAKLDNVLFAPLNLDGITVGIIGIANKPGGFNERDAHFAAAFGELAAISLSNSKMITNLERSQEKFSSVVESATDAIIIIDTLDNVSYWNRSAERIFGYSSAEILGKPLSTIIPARFRTAHMAGMKRVLAGGEQRVIGKTVELAAMAKDGREFPIELSLSSWQAGGEVFFTGLIRDITLKKKAESELKSLNESLEMRVNERTEELAKANEELSAEVKARKLSEEAVRESEQRHRQILKTALDGFAAVDENGIFLDMNESFQKMTGYSHEELIGKPISIIDVEKSQPEIRFHLGKIKDKGWDSFQTKFIRKDGAVIDVDINTAYTEAPEGIIFAFARDVTRRNQDEIERKKLAAAVQQAAESVIITDPDGVITYVNPAFESLTGYSSAETIGRRANILKSGNHDKAFYDELWDTIKRGSSWSGRFIDRKKNGSLFELAMTISPVLNSKSEILNFVAVARDVSHESMLKKARDYFTAVTSHELRGPVSNLQLIKALLRGMKTDSMEKQYIENILDESMDGLNRIISATSLMDDLSKPDSGKSFYLFYPYLTLATSLEKANSEIAKAGRNLALNVDFSSFPKDARMQGDQEMLSRALDIIFSNAIKFTPDGRGINVTARVEGSKVIIVTEDQGIGIDKESLSQLFEPYFSLQNPLHYSQGEYAFKGGGMGLGLALCRMIIEHHRGAVSIKSNGNNQGVTVTVTLPLKIAER